MKKIKSPYHGFRFPGAVIRCAVRWYHRFSLSLRDIEELLLELPGSACVSLPGFHIRQRD